MGVETGSDSGVKGRGPGQVGLSGGRTGALQPHGPGADLGSALSASRGLAPSLAVVVGLDEMMPGKRLARDLALSKQSGNTGCDCSCVYPIDVC